MRDYSSITQVKISESEAETNRLLSEDWVLLDVYRGNQTPLFILGQEFHFDDLDMEA